MLEGGKLSWEWEIPAGHPLLCMKHTLLNLKGYKIFTNGGSPHVRLNAIVFVGELTDEVTSRLEVRPHDKLTVLPPRG